MSYYLKDGELLWPTEAGAYDLRESLPVGTYTVGSSPKGFYLKPITEFRIEGKIYGNTPRQADRILNTFHNRPNATGVLLNGEKGSGKTMLAKLISQKAAEQGISTLVINTPFCGDSFNTFIQNIDEPCVIVFDEFEKVFDEDQQAATLTLLDGVYPTKKLFILTVNDKYRVNQHMRNRPGRIFYMIAYKGVDIEFIREYCQDRLEDKQHIETIVRMTMMFDSFNFDMLKALVEEMNRYGETPNQALEMLNAKPFVDGGSAIHNVKIIHKGTEVPQSNLHNDKVRGNPVVHDSLSFHYTVPTGKVDEDGDEEVDYVDCEITPQDLKKIDAESGTFTYVLREGTPEMSVIVLTREKIKAYNWQDSLA
jgi:hypothetical protein